jgi:phage gp29-like protein
MVPPGEEVPPEKFLVSTFKPRHGDRRGLPLLRRLFWASWFKRQGLRLDLQFLEKGQGTIAVQYPQTADEGEKSKALEVAEAIANEVAVAVPASMQVMDSLLSGTRRREGKDYQLMTDYFDSEMTRMILGQTLTTRGSEQQRGTQALGEVHQNLLIEFVKRDAGDLSTVIDEQLLTPWLRWTFGDVALDRAFRPYFVIDCEPEEDVLNQAKILQAARGLVDVPLAEAYRRLQIPEPEEGEALVHASVIPVELTGLGGGPQPPDDQAGDQGQGGFG